MIPARGPQTVFYLLCNLCCTIFVQSLLCNLSCSVTAAPRGAAVTQTLLSNRCCAIFVAQSLCSLCCCNLEIFGIFEIFGAGQVGASRGKSGQVGAGQVGASRGKSGQVGTRGFRFLILFRCLDYVWIYILFFCFLFMCQREF